MMKKIIVTCLLLAAFHASTIMANTYAYNVEIELLCYLNITVSAPQTSSQSARTHCYGFQLLTFIFFGSIDNSLEICEASEFVTTKITSISWALNLRGYGNNFLL